MSVNFDLMEKCELQRMCVELFKQFEDFKKSSIDHLQRLKNFEVEKDMFIEKIKSLEDDLMNSKLPLDKPFNSGLSIGSIASVSHAMSAQRTMFIKPSMSHNHTQSTCGASFKNFNYIPTCHHCGISVISALFTFRFVLRNFGINCMYQVKNLSDQVKLISGKLGSLTPNENKSVLTNNKKKTSKQV